MDSFGLMLMAAALGGFGGHPGSCNFQSKPLTEREIAAKNRAEQETIAKARAKQARREARKNLSAMAKEREVR